MKLNWKFWRRHGASAALPGGGTSKRMWAKLGGRALGACVLGALALGWWWSYEPPPFEPVAVAAASARQADAKPAPGYTTAVTVAVLAETLLNKRGGYLSNDIAPPGVYLDNTPSWEFGVLTHLRVISRALRNEFSRAQSQSTEDPDLAVAEGHFHYSNDSWIFPASESEYQAGVERVRAYAARLANVNDQTAQFHVRADNLGQWLDEVESRLGDLSLRLSQSVGGRQLNLDLPGQSAGRQAADDAAIETTWLEIDDVFFEARGQAWALIHLLKAVEHDFASVLDDKNARAGLEQIIRQLEATQTPVWSPVILNGDGFGFLANHSLVMASYISRANAALIRLRDLLDRG